MKEQQVRDNLNNFFGRSIVTAYSASDSVIYVPAKEVELLEKAGKLQEVGLSKEVIEDKFFNSSRHINQGTALRAFLI